MIEDKLIKETEKWLDKIDTEFKMAGSSTKKGNEFLKNISAYIEDSKYFLKQKMFIEAFEAVIWAWAYLEIGNSIKIIKIQRN